MRHKIALYIKTRSNIKLSDGQARFGSEAIASIAENIYDNTSRHSGQGDNHQQIIGPILHHPSLLPAPKGQHFKMWFSEQNIMRLVGITNEIKKF